MFFPQTFTNETLYTSPSHAPPQKKHTPWCLAKMEINIFHLQPRFALKCCRKISDFQKNLAALGRPGRPGREVVATTYP